MRERDFEEPKEAWHVSHVILIDGKTTAHQHLFVIFRGTIPSPGVRRTSEQAVGRGVGAAKYS